MISNWKDVTIAKVTMEMTASEALALVDAMAATKGFPRIRYDEPMEYGGVTEHEVAILGVVRIEMNAQ
jgi:hypothetical protein